MGNTMGSNELHGFSYGKLRDPIVSHEKHHGIQCIQWWHLSRSP
jgi:hypothetical protein